MAAPLLRRMAALGYDLLPAAALTILAALLAVIAAGGQAIEPGTAWFGAWLAAWNMAYFGFCWRRGGQTLGMRAWRLRLIHTQGRLPWSAVLIRLLIGPMATLPLAWGWAWALFDTQKRTLHDRLSGSRMVLEVRPD